MPLDPTARGTVKRAELEDRCTGLVLAVSGGADSMAMLLWYASRSLPFPLTVAHVHHGLRPESEEEALLVHQVCREKGIPCHVLRTDVKREMQKGETVESTARRLRYSFFREVALQTGASHVATAHTADDQAETVLLHLIHGAGMKGLCGILPKRQEEGITLIRPLLDCTREDTEAYCRERSVPFAQDATNRDLTYTRNRIRHSILPSLREINPKVISALCRTADALQKHQAAAELRAREILTQHPDALPCETLRSLPEGEQSEVLRLFCADRGKILSAEQTRQALGLLNKAEGTVEFDRRWRLHLGQNRITLIEKNDLPDREDFPVHGEITRLPDGTVLRLIKTTATKQNRSGLIPCTLPLILRTRRRGDKVSTPGGTKSLAKIMMEQNIPAEHRDRLRILADGDGILWCEALSITLKRTPKPGEEAYFVSLSEE